MKNNFLATSEAFAAEEAVSKEAGACDRSASRRYKLAVFFSHPTQHHSAMFQCLAKKEDIDLHVYYYDPGLMGGMFDSGYGTNAPWDVDLTSGLNARLLRNILRGREVEQFLGRRGFLRLYLCLLLIGPLVLTAAGWFMPAILFGSSTLHFGIFIAFALLYPSAGIFFGLAARWVAIILLAIYTLQGFANNDWERLIVLWTTTPFVFLFVQHARGRISLPSFSFFERKPKFTVVAPPPNRRRDLEADDDLESIDPLLDKIARSGMGSLTAKERARLEKAREALIRKDRQ